MSLVNIDTMTKKKILFLPPTKMEEDDAYAYLWSRYSENKILLCNFTKSLLNMHMHAV